MDETALTDDEKARLCVKIAAFHHGDDADTQAIERAAVEYMLRADEEILFEWETVKVQQSKNESRRQILYRHGKTHEGRMAIADGVYTGRLPMREVEKALASKDMDEVRSLYQNPCGRCESVRIEEDWLGSGYCSLGCCEWTMKHGEPRAREYATLMFQDWLALQ